MSREQNATEKSLFDRIAEKLMSFSPEVDDVDDTDDTDYMDEEPEVKGYRDRDESAAPKSQRPSAEKHTNNVIKFNRDNMPQKFVEITDPANVEEAARCVDYLKQGSIVTINLEEVDVSEKQRVADFISGAAYFSGAVMRRLSDNMFIVTPTDVGINGGTRDTGVPAASDKYELPRVASYR